MPSTTPGAAIILTASQIRASTIGVAAVMIVIGMGGLAASLIADKDLPTVRIATTAAFAGLLIIGLIITVVAGLRGQAAVIKHQKRIEEGAGEHFAELGRHQARMEQAATEHFARLEKMIEDKIEDGLQDRFDQLESILMAVHDMTQRQSTIVGDVFAEQIRRRDDALAQRRERRNG